MLLNSFWCLELGWSMPGMYFKFWPTKLYTFDMSHFFESTALYFILTPHGWEFKLRKLLRSSYAPGPTKTDSPV